MKPFPSRTFADSRQSLAQIFICCRTRKERLAQRAQIKAGAPYDHGYLPARFNLLNLLNCRARPVSRSEGFEGRNKIAQVMRNVATFCDGNLRGRNLYLLIDLN